MVQRRDHHRRHTASAVVVKYPEQMSNHRLRRWSDTAGSTLPGLEGALFSGRVATKYSRVRRPDWSHCALAGGARSAPGRRLVIELHKPVAGRKARQRPRWCTQSGATLGQYRRAGTTSPCSPHHQSKRPSPHRRRRAGEQVQIILAPPEQHGSGSPPLPPVIFTAVQGSACSAFST